MKIIDAHTHFFPDAVAGKAIPKMEQTSGEKAFHDGTLAGLIGSMDDAGIELSVVLPVATNPLKVDSLNRFSAAVDSGRVVMAGGLHPHSPRWREELELMLALGFGAVKLHPDYQEFYPDDENLRPFFAALRDAGVTVAFHVGADLSYDPPYGGPPERIAALMDALPGLKVYATHMGGFRMWDAVERRLAGREDVLMDTSFSFGFMPEEQLRRIIAKHGAERVMYGSDSPWLDQAEQVENVRRLGLSSRDEELILYDNARRMIDSWRETASRYQRQTGE